MITNLERKRSYSKQILKRKDTKISNYSKKSILEIKNKLSIKTNKSEKLIQNEKIIIKKSNNYIEKNNKIFEFNINKMRFLLKNSKKCIYPSIFLTK